VLTRVKASFARRGETIELRWQDGVFIAQHESTGLFGSIEKRSCEGVFLDLLDRVIAEGRHVTDSNHSTRFVPKAFAQRKDRERFGKKDFERAMERLFEQRQIRPSSYKAPDRKLYQCIARTEAAEPAQGAGGVPASG
jgi:hypothetical protein